MSLLIADSGATKTTWTVLGGKRKKTITTPGISPYFFSSAEITALLREQLVPHLPKEGVSAVYFYGTGCATPDNKALVKTGIKKAIPSARETEVQSDLMAAARALCGREKGISCILGTGSNSCVFNGKKIVRNNPAPGFILGDEGSGAYLGKKVVQYFIYETFDEELMHRFRLKFNTSYREILQQVYKEPWPNRYLASFAPFLSENRGHFMIENIIEDGLTDFVTTHLFKYPETWTLPVHFVGSIAWHFRDMLAQVCEACELNLGKVLQSPMQGLIQYHSES